MITDLFGYPVASVGYYGGWLTSAYFMAQIFSSVIMGQLSDIKGRRIIMLIGMTGNLITTIVFGMSRTFWLALLARFACGLINGNIGVIKSYIREITDETNQARCYTLRSAGYSVGAIIGPILGGALARPAIQYPGTFSSTGLWAHFPFLLPCLASAAVTAFSLILSILFLQETVKPIPYEEYEEDSVEMAPVALPANRSGTFLSSADTLDLEVAPSEFSYEEVAPSEDPTSPGKVSAVDTKESASSAADSQAEDPDAAIIPIDPEIAAAPARERKIRGKRSMKAELHIFWHQLKSRLYLFGLALRERDVVFSIILYSGVSFIILGFDEVFAFWAILPVASGGVNFTTLQVGTAHAISGVGAIIMQLFGYVPLDKALGTRNTLTASMTALAPSFVVAPLANHLTGSKASIWSFISFIMIMKAACGTTGFASVNLLVSNASDSQTSGAVNGMSASTAALARMFAPVIVGSIFAATSNATVGWPFDYGFVFYFLALLCLLIAAGSKWGLPKSIDKRKA